MITQRDVGAAAIKLIGLYFASRVVALYAALMVTPYLMSAQAFSSSDPLLAASISSAVGNFAVAVTFLFGADRIAAALFTPTEVPPSGSRRDLLFAGIALIGVWLAADAAAALLRAGGSYLYYVQQDLPTASLVRSWPQVAANVASLAMGVGLALSARRVATRLDPASDPSG